MTQKKTDLFKVVNKGSKNSHQKPISTCIIGTEWEEKKKKIGVGEELFQIVGKRWYKAGES